MKRSIRNLLLSVLFISLFGCNSNPTTVAPTQLVTDNPILSTTLSPRATDVTAATSTAKPTPTATHVPSPTPTRQPSILFDDSGSMLLLRNTNTELALNKRNGSILSITDLRTGVQLMRTASSGSLWSIPYHDGAQYVFSSDSSLRFSYQWDEAAHRLTLSYAPYSTSGKFVSVTVTINMDEADTFDLQMNIDNQWGVETFMINFPERLAFKLNEVQEALLPTAPGIVLERGFFERAVDYISVYPSWPGVFADFTALTLTGGKLTFYSNADRTNLVPSHYGFRFAECGLPQVVCYEHVLHARVKSGNQWSSPIFTIRVGEEWAESISAYRRDARIDEAPSLQEKLGQLFSQVVSSPLYKSDAVLMNILFTYYPSQILERIPEPGILHLVSYGQDGFDRNYPDFLPPWIRFGTTEELSYMAKKARELGFLVMPYTNPTWWDPGSPTLRDIPDEQLEQEVLAINESGEPIRECYAENCGVVVSPFAPFVQNRLARLMMEITEADVADLLFEDQVGVRGDYYDFNPSMPNADATLLGWLDHSEEYADMHLMTEGGYDQLVGSEVGMTLSAFLDERYRNTQTMWGNGTWHYYPFVVQAAGDKVLFYQHAVAHQSMTHDKQALLVNTAMGFMLGHDLAESDDFHGGIKGDFLPVVGAFQRYVLSTYAGQRVTAYETIDENVTCTQFEDVSVVANWDPREPYQHGEYTLPGYGILIQNQDHTLTAGIFYTYNGFELSSGDHYLIEQRQNDEVIIRQPKGFGTQLRILAENAWGEKATIQAYAKDGKLLSEEQGTVEDGAVTFHYQLTIDRVPVSYYRISGTK